MRLVTLSRSALSLSLCAAALAQTTHVVGPGLVLQNLRTAVQAASPGDIVVVRPGTYDNIWVDKELTILGDPGAILYAPLSTAIEVYNLPAGSRVAIHGFELASNSFGTQPIWLHDNLGHVHLEGVVSPFKIKVERCDQVSLRNVDVIGAPAALHVIDSEVVVTRSQFVGLEGIAVRHPGLRAENSQVTAVDCEFQGSPDRFAIVGGGVGAWLVASDVTFTGNTRILGGTSPNGPPSDALQIGAGSRAIVDPLVQLLPSNGGGPRGGAGTLVAQASPSVGGSASTTQLALRVRGTPGGTAVLYVGERRSPALPTPFGAIWLGRVDVIRVQSLSATGTAITTLPLPPLPLGTFVTAQAGILAGSAIAITPPLVLRLDP